jgi:hypothetical protein
MQLSTLKPSVKIKLAWLLCFKTRLDVEYSSLGW